MTIPETIPDGSNESDKKATAEQITQDETIASGVLVSSSGVKYHASLFKTIYELDMPIRAHNAFIRSNITYLGDLVTIPAKDLIRIDNLGRKSLEAVSESLKHLGLKFDMDIGAWPPVDFLNLIKQYEMRFCNKNRN